MWMLLGSVSPAKFARAGPDYTRTGDCQILTAEQNAIEALCHPPRTREPNFYGITIATEQKTLQFLTHETTMNPQIGFSSDMPYLKNAMSIFHIATAQHRKSNSHSCYELLCCGHAFTGLQNQSQ